ncbi:MAG: 50S ribosomal protein L6 [Nitrospinae bacterium RIFCSPLOWO2_12_FULL_45_22]|uniref:Large ribosomal subunit protein uL6 n=1 Tax=uncultured bacterium Rifle_16ft_4_minimus_4226 TaxID=1665160 RepID=A0A0H4T8E7_9BACT|nr:50S ribosomal protein L6, large subunit ribosomal protein L6 [uncultured bacterium Rifle_16ft_4_minimus_4226]OGW14989.1 MAG: 50S ribosomal protein L6 [Nitrospinae bacterium RIFCSPLOWO2_12_FULL_45_22]
MSRIGRKAIDIPPGVTVELNNGLVQVKGPKGILSQPLNPRLSLRIDNQKIIIERNSADKKVKALHGLTRTLINNMIIGVTQGFQKSLDIVGVGYRAALQGKTLTLQIGYSHPINYKAPEGIDFQISQKNIIAVSGIDKQLVGQVAAQIRAFRKPDPYKGKGIKYLGEQIRRKAGKTKA